MFSEYSATVLTEMSEGVEVFLHFNENGKFIYAYCWADAIPTFLKQNTTGDLLLDADGWYKEYTPKVKIKENKLFVGLPLTIKNYFNQMYISATNDNEGDYWANDEIMLQAIKMYPRLEVES